MSHPILIIHGWSDASRSFRRLAEYVRSVTGQAVDTINLADWMSLDDDVTYVDLVHAMQRAWVAKQLPQDPRSIDVIVHSTGSLVTRDWMSTFFKAETCPIHRFLMLAPANFGSPLAHKGRAWTGRLAKGYKSRFETGYHILKGLELGSPYVWDLAHRDLLPQGRSRWYGPGRILATCLVGNAPYPGVRAAISEDGSDGTVRVAGANPNVSRLSLDYCVGDKGNPITPKYKLVSPGRNKIAFTTIPSENHGTITFNGARNPRSELTPSFISGALAQTDDSYPLWCDELHDHHRQTQSQPSHDGGEASDAHYHGYQDTIIRVHDQFDQSVMDYLVEFKVDDRDRSRFARLFHRDVLRKVHVHSDNASYRSFYMDIDTLRSDVDRAGEGLRIALTASPIFTGKRGSPPVGYLPLASTKEGALFVPWESLDRFFQPDRTLLVDIQIQRVAADSLFEIRSSSG